MTALEVPADTFTAYQRSVDRLLATTRQDGAATIAAAYRIAYHGQSMSADLWLDLQARRRDAAVPVRTTLARYQAATGTPDPGWTIRWVDSHRAADAVENVDGILAALRRLTAPGVLRELTEAAVTAALTGENSTTAAAEPAPMGAPAVVVLEYGRNDRAGIPDDRVQLLDEEAP